MKSILIKLSFLLSILLYTVSCNNNEKLEADGYVLFNKYYEHLKKVSYSEYDSLITFYKQVDSIYTKYPNNYFYYLKNITSARIHYRESNYNQSNRNYKEAVRVISTLTENDSLIALAYNGIGVNFLNNSLFDSSYYYLQKSIALYEKINQPTRVSVLNANIAQLYYNKGDNEKALEYINKSISQTKDTSTLLLSLHLKANIMGSHGDIDSAMAIDREVINKYQEPNNKYLINSFYNNLALCHLYGTNKLDSAIFYCKKSYYVDSILGLKINMGANLMLLGDIYKGINPSVSKQYYDRAFTIFTEGKNYDKKLQLFTLLSNNAQRENNFKEALNYKDSIFQTYKKINNLATNRTIELLNIEYESQKRETQIITQNRQISFQKSILFLLIITSSLGIGTLILYAKNRDKKNKLKLAEQRQRTSKMLLDAEEAERRRIAQDLHDSVNQKLAVMQMYLSSVNKHADAIDKTKSILEDSIIEIRDISKKLYSSDLESGLLYAIERLCEQNNLVNDSVILSNSCDNFDETVISRNNKLIVYRVIQELVNNANKHSNASQIDIAVKTIDNKIIVIVRDNGKGFDIKFAENSEGMGLKSVRKRIEDIGGDFSITSKKGEGSEFVIEIPIDY